MLPRALLLAVSVPVLSATVATAEPTEPRDLMARSLARCCGKKRATLGPLFRTIAIAPADMSLIVDGLPPNLQPDKVGLTITPLMGLGPDAMHLDGLAIDIPDHQLCVQLRKRLEMQWGRASPWVDATRRVASSIESSGPAADATCVLHFDRLPSSNAARCRSDEVPNTTWEIDIQAHCLRPARPRGCRLDRDTRHGFCSVDEDEKFWKTVAPADGRFCTREELDRVDFHALDECGQPPSVRLF